MAETWPYVAVSCGAESVNVAVSGTQWITGTPITPVGTSSLVTVYGQPAAVVGSANVSTARVGSLVDVTFTVLDDCPTASRIPGMDVALVVAAGGGSVTPGAGITDGNGEVRTLLYGGRPGARRTGRLPDPEHLQPADRHDPDPDLRTASAATLGADLQHRGAARPADRGRAGARRADSLKGDSIPISLVSDGWVVPSAVLAGGEAGPD